MFEKLQNKQRFLTAGAKAVNPFAKFPGPDGNYYAQLIRIVWSEDAKSGCAVVRAAFMIIASVEDNSTTWGAIPTRIQFYLRESEKSSEQDAWDRLYTGLYQALGCVTAQWPTLLDAAGQPVPILVTLQQETDRLIKEHPCVVLSIISNPKDVRYQNINIREVLASTALDHFTLPSMEIDDTQLNEPGEEDNTIPDDESTLPNFAEQVQQVKDALAPLDVAGMLEQAKASQLDLDFDTLASSSVAVCRATVLCSFLEKNGYVPSDYDLSFPGDSEQPENGGEIREVARNPETGSFSEAIEEVFEELEEQEEVLEEVELSEEDRRRLQISTFVSGLDRKGTQLKIRSFDKEFKFFQKQTDEDLKIILTDMLIVSSLATF